VVAPVRRVPGHFRKLRAYTHPRSPELWLRCVRLRSAVCMLGRFPALAGADLDVDSGEVLLLSGPNGAGKTTLLRLCAGLLPLRAGEAEVLGVDLAVEPRRVRRAVALVGHETFCYDDLTVAENVRFVARSTGNSTADADEALERVGLQRIAKVAHGRLSQGQRRRLSLANAIARKPRLLLLDEPHAGLDEQGRAVLEDVVRAAPGMGCTVMLASHELDLARRLSTREVRIVAGQVHGVPRPVVVAEVEAHT
jgi:heme ABC exporter ATP-binding subunit CcmA